MKIFCSVNFGGKIPAVRGFATVLAGKLSCEQRPREQTYKWISLHKNNARATSALSLVYRNNLINIIRVLAFN